MLIREFLRSRHVPFETLLHSPAPSAARLAGSVHVSGGRVAKAVLIRAGSDFALTVLPATHRIDLTKLAGVLGTADVRIATEAELEGVFGDCELGAVPPFGTLYGMRTFVDASLSGGSDVVIEGNTRHEGLRLRYRDFEAIEHPSRVRFAEPIAPRRKKASHRRAS